MSPNCNFSGRPNDQDPAIGMLLCLLVVAYIYYIHTTFQQQLPAQDQPQQPVGIIPVASTENPVVEANSDSVIRTPYDKGYFDGMQAYLRFDIADIRRVKATIEKRDNDSQTRAQMMEKKLEDFEKEYVQIESAMKAWREEYLKVLWEVKQKGERGLLTGWFRFGSPRASGRIVREEVEDAKSKAGEERRNEKEVQYDDMKKG